MSGDWHYLYRTPEWQILRINQLARSPDCERCARRGKHTPATCVHHIVAHRGDPGIFFDETNLASLCKACHDGAAQSEEKRGYSTEIGLDGFPTDPKHPFHRGHLPKIINERSPGSAGEAFTCKTATKKHGGAYG